MPAEIYAPIVVVIALTLLIVVLAVRRTHHRHQAVAPRTAPPTLWTPAASLDAAFTPRPGAVSGRWTEVSNDVWGDAR